MAQKCCHFLGGDTIAAIFQMADFGCATNVSASFHRHDKNGDAANPPIKKWRKSVAIFWVATRMSPSGGHSHPCMAQSPGGLGSAADFHAGCNGNQYTITVIKTEDGNIFGGVSDVDWGSSANSAWSESFNSFVFCIKCAGSPTDADGNPVPEKMKLFQNQGYAIYSLQTVGPTFGGAHDLSIADKPGDAKGSYSSLGYTYKCPNDEDGNSCGEYLNGGVKGERGTFNVADYEVYTFSLDLSLSPVR